MVQDLVLRLSSLDANKADEQARRDRLAIVKIAATALQLPEAAQAELQRLCPPTVDPSEVFKSWRLLGRPVTNLKILARIAKLLPNFRSTTFNQVALLDRIKLQRNLVTTLPTAYSVLGVGKPSAVYATLAGKAHRFKKDCSGALPCHYEIQLLMRYEAEFSLTPTLAYFGCSKKACFLCESFLASSVLKPRTRGGHGIYHPL